VYIMAEKRSEMKNLSNYEILFPIKGLLHILLALFLFTGCSQQQEEALVDVGSQAPDFAAKDLDGNVVILSYFEDNPVVLRFWETDCRFCRADTPIINVYFEKYRDQGLKVIYVAASTETKAKVESFIRDLEVPYPVILDKEAKIADLYDVLLYPQTIFIAPGRMIKAIVPGGVGEAELDELVGPYLTK